MPARLSIAKKLIRSKVKERDKHICQYCLRKAGTMDHIIPESKGGLWTEDNLVVACADCNNRKDNLSVEAFADRHRKYLLTKKQTKKLILHRIWKIQQRRCKTNMLEVK